MLYIQETHCKTQKYASETNMNFITARVSHCREQNLDTRLRSGVSSVGASSGGQTSTRCTGHHVRRHGQSGAGAQPSGQGQRTPRAAGGGGSHAVLPLPFVVPLTPGCSGLCFCFFFFFSFFFFFRSFSSSLRFFLCFFSGGSPASVPSCDEVSPGRCLCFLCLCFRFIGAWLVNRYCSGSCGQRGAEGRGAEGRSGTVRAIAALGAPRRHCSQPRTAEQVDHVAAKPCESDGKLPDLAQTHRPAARSALPLISSRHYTASGYQDSPQFTEPDVGGVSSSGRKQQLHRQPFSSLNNIVIVIIRSTWTSAYVSLG